MPGVDEADAELGVVFWEVGTDGREEGESSREVRPSRREGQIGDRSGEADCQRNGRVVGACRRC